MNNSTTIAAAVKDFILREFLPEEDPDELQSGTPLITTGILDSIATLKLVSFLEKQYAITLAAHEATVENLNTIDDVTKLVHVKLGSA